jgi:hypothetical protein
LSAQSQQDPITKWNDAAQSQVLDKNELAKIGAAFPSWKIKQITWPPMPEIDARSVTVDEELKASCLGWLKKFMKKEYLPSELGNNLVAMKNWGLIRKESEQKRLCDVFIARFKKFPYVIHMQESPYNVVIGVGNEGIPTDSRAEHKELVIETGTLLLSETLKPDQDSDLRPFDVVRDGSRISRVVWMTKGVATTDTDGKKCANLINASKNGAINVVGETDGRFVTFTIVKCVKGPKSYLDPYVERFSAPKSEAATGGD